MLGGTPIYILKEGTERESGRGAQMKNIAAAKAIAEAVRSTLGPKGMDKMLVDSLGDVTITNDGVTILKEIDVVHPAAKMIVEVAKAQDQECGDGTTTAVVLAGELLTKAEEMLEQNVHPTTITRGYAMASKKSVELLEKLGVELKVDDEKILKNIAITSMTGKSAGRSKEYLAELAVKAVKEVAEKEDKKYKVDLDNVKIEKKHGGTIEDTELIKGIILDKEKVHPGMPDKVKDAKIALINAALEIKKTEIDANIRISDPSQLQAFLDEEERMLKSMVEKIKATGANVVFCQKGIDDMAQHFLAKEGIYAVRRVKKSDMEKLAKATGANIVTTLDDLGKNDLGHAGMVEERKIGDDEMTFVTDCKNPRAVSILVRGGTEHVVDEIERILNDALHTVSIALEDGKLISGGGASAVELALNLRDYAATIGGREQLAIEAFADALEAIPKTLAENAGLDVIDVLIKLRKAHKDGDKYAGLDVFTGDIVDMRERNVVEPIRVGRQAIEAATEVANMILRIDDVIAAKGESKSDNKPPSSGGDEDF